MNRAEVGKTGENLACEFLKKKYYRILDRNKWKPWGEIDIIARAPDGTLVFVEVKTLEHRASALELEPEDNLTSAKMKKLNKTCQMYVAQNQKLIDEKRGWRIDLVAISLRGADGTGGDIGSKDYVINHYENI